MSKYQKEHRKKLVKRTHIDRAMILRILNSPKSNETYSKEERQTIKV